MKISYLNKSVSVISLAIAGITFSTAVDAVQAIAEGVYWGGGSRYIQIAKRINKGQNADEARVCYQGFSANGSMISSLQLTIPRYQTGMDYEVYTVPSVSKEFGVLAIQQFAFSRDKILFGNLVGRMVSQGIEYKLDPYFPSTRSPELQECLNSNQNFFKRILPNR